MAEYGSTEQNYNKTMPETQEMSGVDLVKVSRQIQNEWEIAERFIRDWRATKRIHTKLLLNQRKNPKKVGDTLLFSTHQTILAALYHDRLDAEWMGRDEDDTDRSDQLNALYAFDYDEMGKAAHDFGKYWDATFYGIAIEDYSHFDRDSLTPIPDLWDPLTTYFDPKATSINGNALGRGASRFIGRDIMRTKDEMTDLGFFNLSALSEDTKGLSELNQTAQQRAAARNLTEVSFDDIKDNCYYALLQWFTYINGQRYLVEAGNKGKTIVRLDPVRTDYWPVNEARIYPDPHTLVTPGIADFVEDKQRARAILTNNTLDAAKLDTIPMWLFDKRKIKNRAQLTNWKAGKVIEGENIDGNTMMPITKPGIAAYTDGLMNLLELNAQKALATTELQQGMIFNQKRSATEVAEAANNTNTRYSLTAALFSQSEQNAAYMWLDQYKRNFKKIDEKIIRIMGGFGPKPVPITHDTFKFKQDPDVRIASKVVSLAKKQEDRQNLAQFGQILAGTPNSNMRYFAQEMGRLMFTKEVVQRLLPPTLDEMRAEDENDMLSENTLKGVVIEPTDDHMTHLEIHAKAADTKAKVAHMEAHKKALMIQRMLPELFKTTPTLGVLPQQGPQALVAPPTEPQVTQPQ